MGTVGTVSVTLRTRVQTKYFSKVGRVHRVGPGPPHHRTSARTFSRNHSRLARPLILRVGSFGLCGGSRMSEVDLSCSYRFSKVGRVHRVGPGSPHHRTSARTFSRNHPRVIRPLILRVGSFRLCGGSQRSEVDMLCKLPFF